jgi:DNA-directed RNA polymerase specialized sigma24 family protein
MEDEGEISGCIRRLGKGDSDAEQVIWQQYFSKLVQYARRKLADTPRRAFDEEDVALSAMKSFYQGMEAGRFQSLNDRNELWKLLVTITARKVVAQQRGARRKKRGSGRQRGESVFAGGISDDDENMGIAQVLGEEPTPELAAMVVEDTKRLLDCLENETLRRVAIMKLEGYTNDEAARELGCVRRTIERKLQLIRNKWCALGLA